MVRYTQQSAASKLSVPSEEVTVHNTNAKNSQITMLYILVMQYFRVRSDKGPVAYSTVIPQGSTAQLLYPMPKSSEKLRIFSEKLGYLWKFPKTLKTLQKCLWGGFMILENFRKIFGKLRKRFKMFWGVFIIFKIIGNLRESRKSSNSCGFDWNCSETFAGVENDRN